MQDNSIVVFQPTTKGFRIDLENPSLDPVFLEGPYLVIAFEKCPPEYATAVEVIEIVLHKAQGVELGTVEWCLCLPLDADGNTSQLILADTSAVMGVSHTPAMA